MTLALKIVLTVMPLAMVVQVQQMRIAQLVTLLKITTMKQHLIDAY